MTTDERSKKSFNPSSAKQLKWLFNSEVSTDTERYRRLSFILQIFLIVMWTIHDLGVITGKFSTPVPVGLPIILVFAFIIGIVISVRLSNFLSLFIINAIPFISIGMQTGFTRDTFALSIMWLIWPLIFAIFLLGYRATSFLVSLDFLGLLVLAVVYPDVTLDMLPLPFFIILGASIVAVLGAREREFSLSALKVSEKIQQQQQRELKIYISLLRHDLRNDLGVIMGNTDLIQLTCDEENDVMVETVASTHAVCQRMLNLLTALGISSESSHTDIVSVIQATSLKAQEINPNLTVNVQVDDSVGSPMIRQMKLLPAVFENILRNASVHAGPNPEVEIRILQLVDMFQIFVSDNGLGISEEMHSHVFKRGVSSREGGGLGLYLAKEILEAIGGSIELLPFAPDRGARFLIMIPLSV